MDFHFGLDGIRINWNNSKNKWYKTPTIYGVNKLNLDQTDIIRPEDIATYDTYSTTSMLKSVIDRRGDFLSTGQWQHIKVVGGKRNIVENSPFVKLLEHPNPLQKGNLYIKLWNEMRCIFGNEFEYIGKPVGFNEIGILNLLPPSEMKIEYAGKWYMQNDLNDIINSFKYHENIIEKDEMNYTWLPNSKNPLIGESPLLSIYMEISNFRAANKFLNTIMAKKGALGLLSSNATDTIGSRPLTSDERKDIEKQFEDSHGIGDDQTQTYITNANVAYTPMAYPTNQLGLFETLEQSIQAFCSTFGMHRHLFPSVTGAKYMNQSEAEKQTFNNTIVPLGEELAMNRTKLFKMDGMNEFMYLDFSHVPAMQEDNKEKAEVGKLRSDSVSALFDKNLTPQQIHTIVGFEY